MRIACVVVVLAARVCLAQDVTPPEVLSRVDAQLPADAPAPKQDHVLLEFTIGADGVPTDLQVIESAGDQWDKASLRALEQWRFKPARHEGVPVASRTKLSFSMPKPVAPVSPPEAVDAGASLEAPDAGADDAGQVFSVEGDTVDAGHPHHEMSTTVLGRTVPKSRGVSDFTIEPGELKIVPRPNASDFLKLAPGILLTNEGGEGHPEQIYMRGFDAHEGQDIELSVDGVPINEAGNLHGNGYSDLHFIIPELVENLRVVEGPFDPRQGNFAVAGSADYQLGLAERGLLAKGSYGSFDTSRVVVLWGPPGETSRTFGGVQLFKTAGFGQNRAAQNAKAMAQYEGRFSESTSFRLGAMAYATSYQSAGLLRADDVASGTAGFYDTYDPRQGGDTVRAQVHADLHGHGSNFSYDNTFFGIYTLNRLRENFTGFLHDVQLAQQTPHEQRGDLIDRTSSGVTVGSKGSAKYRGRVLGRLQEIEAGYFARVDVVNGLQQRIGEGGNIPYLREYDLNSTLTDIGAWADLNLSLTDWLILRGGLRAEALSFDVLDNCAARLVRRPDASNPPGDASCLSQRDFGIYREPNERNATTGGVLLPRGTLLIGPFANFTFTGSLGKGVRSIDPQYVTQSLDTPFASIFAWEGGASWANHFDTHDVNARVIAFGTRVDKDLVFNEQEGRGVIGGSTTRVGALFAGRAKGSFYDASVNLTWVQSKFDDTNLLVPYVPDFVGRFDGALFHEVPWFTLFEAPIAARGGAGITYVGRRALPYGQRSDVIFVVDASAELAWKWVTLGFSVTNLLNTQYRLGEFNFASDFHTSGTLPTLVPARMFSAGAPRAAMLTLGLHFGGDS